MTEAPPWEGLRRPPINYEPYLDNLYWNFPAQLHCAGQLEPQVQEVLQDTVGQRYDWP